MTCRALIVDDESLLVFNLAKALSDRGLEARPAMSVGEAVSELEKGRFDLLCVDINLQDGNGLDLIQFAREKQPDLPVIVMTGRDNVANRLRAEGLDANAFLAKPFALAQFRELARCLIGRDKLAGEKDSSTGTAPRVLMYSHDSIGLGHVRRNSNIACTLVEKVPDASVLMMVGSPAGVGFELPPGVDFVKLPSVTKTARDTFEPGKLRISQEQTKTLRETLLLQAAQSFQPDIFLADHVPTGVWSELIPTLRYLKSRPRPTRIVLGLRDVLDAPEKVAETWAKNGTRDAIAEFYDDILIYGERGIFDTAAFYGLDRIAPARSRYCGYVIAAEADEIDPEDDRYDHETPSLVVTAGGGFDAFPMMENCFDALDLMTPDQRPEALFITGPLMPIELRTKLERRAEMLGARLVKSMPSALPLIAHADIVVTMGGYNTMVEAVHFGTPTIIVPRMGPSAEQRTRADRFAALGMVRCLYPQDASAERLATEIRAQLVAKRGASRRLDTGGAGRAADLLASMIEQRKNPARAPRQLTG